MAVAQLLSVQGSLSRLTCCGPSDNSTRRSRVAVLVRVPCLSRCGWPPVQRMKGLSVERHPWRVGSSIPFWQPVRATNISCSLIPAASFSASLQASRRVVLLVINVAVLLLSGILGTLKNCPPLLHQLLPAVGLMAFSLVGLAPLVHLAWRVLPKKDDSIWEKSQAHTVLTTYVRPLLIWAAITMICRSLDQVQMEPETSHNIKQRTINFVRSLSTVIVFTFCTGSLIQQVQKFLMKRSALKDSRNISVQFIGNAAYTSVWVAAVCLFLELLGFSTHKWLAAGGFGTVLLTLAGREIFTNFLSSMMIHATKPFVESEWIQTKIEGQEVSGTVEHVGWWSPTVIRGDEREAVHIPNHKFSVSVVRNLTQKTHWRIKTHIGISHLDVNKISGIVADMRKVLTRHPQIEQQRLHRRIFFDYINQKNLALMIMVSCFVKTSRFEDYLRVKEVVLLDLLKVVADHNARLATPIRSMYRATDSSEAHNVSYNRTRLLNSGSLVNADDESETISSTPKLERKSSLKSKTAKESTQSVDTVTVSADSKDQIDALSKWKAIKKHLLVQEYHVLQQKESHGLKWWNQSYHFSNWQLTMGLCSIIPLFGAIMSLKFDLGSRFESS